MLDAGSRLFGRREMLTGVAMSVLGSTLAAQTQASSAVRALARVVSGEGPGVLSDAVSDGVWGAPERAAMVLLLVTWFPRSSTAPPALVVAPRTRHRPPWPRRRRSRTASQEFDVLRSNPSRRAKG